tara:strand:- start:573 stop:779 length:207 start_codon:yes stop_codon:yes gene_type:complete
MIRVEGHQHLYRDEKTGAIINTDTNSYNQYVSSIQRKKAQKKELSDMRKEIDELKSMLKEILDGPKSK